jgi:hypothetical protein
MDAISRREAMNNDELVEALVEQLKQAGRGRDRSMPGSLNDPRPEAQSRTPLDSYVREVVRQSIERLRLPAPVAYVDEVATHLRSALRLGWPLGSNLVPGVVRVPDVAPVLTETEAMVIRAALDRLQGPRTPRGADPIAYLCASEFACLMDWFCLKGPTLTKGGPFLIGSALLYEARTGEPAKNMRNACNAVLKARKPFRQMHDE